VSLARIASILNVGGIVVAVTNAISQPGAAERSVPAMANARRRSTPVSSRCYLAMSPAADESSAVTAVWSTAIARVGLTLTGFCALAALGAAQDEGPLAPVSTDLTAGQPAANRTELARREALAALQAELADARLAVVRVGTNLNQAARVLNATGDLPVWLRHVAEVCARALGAVDAAATRVHRRL
jgi:hypothetical protein